MRRTGWMALAALLLAACGAPRTYAEREDFRAHPEHRRDFAAAPAPVCEAARRVLLGDGYRVESGKGGEGGADVSLAGAKEFQVDDQAHALLRVHVVCAEAAGGTTLFVTATEEHFDVKTRRESVSIGVPALAPVTVGTKSESDHQVKTLGTTVTDRRFYERFHQAVQRELERRPGGSGGGAR